MPPVSEGVADGPGAQAASDGEHTVAECGGQAGGGGGKREGGEAGEAAEETGGEKFLGEVVRESPGGNEETADRIDDNERRGGVVKQGRELHA